MIEYVSSESQMGNVSFLYTFFVFMHSPRALEFQEERLLMPVCSGSPAVSATMSLQALLTLLQHKMQELYSPKPGASCKQIFFMTQS